MKLYICELGQFSAEMLTRMQKMLPPKRRAQVAEAKTEAQRSAKTVAFYLVHYAANQEAPLPLADWEYGACGKPQLARSPLHFSLSHTAHAVAVLISKAHPVGVDIEVIRPHAAGFAARWFSKEECAQLLAEKDYDAALTRLWCAKEAAAKRDGTGLGGHVAEINATDTKTAQLTLGGVPHALAISPAAALSTIPVDAEALLP